ncbi:MAG: hypothetical protein H7A36_01845 [Chlamydiales bacterium]|nr:hypothetical protein [Chlamydiales bacterium]
MKRLLLLLLAAAPLSALPLQNPMLSTMFSDGLICEDSCGAAFFGLFDVRLGFYGDYVYNTHMKVKRPGNSGNVRKTSVMTNAGEVTVNFCNFDVFATVGATNIDVLLGTRSLATSGTDQNNLLEITTDAGTSWSVGGRWAIWDCGAFGLGIEGQYFSASPSLNSLIGYARAEPIYFNGQDVNYRAWQVGLGVNWMIPITECYSLNPYWGGFWTDSKMTFGNATALISGFSNVNVQLFDIEKNRQYGWAFGVTWLNAGLATITAEGRWAGEKAAFLSGQIQY